MTLTDGQIDELSIHLNNIKVGCRVSFDKLYVMSRRRLAGVVSRILSDSCETEDCLQEIYIKVWQQADSFESGRGEGMVWLLRVARNAALDRLRQRALRPFHISLAADEEDGTAPSLEPPSVEDGPMLTLSKRQVDAWVHRSVQSLQPAQRECLGMALYHGLTQMQVSSETGRPLGTVKSNIRRSIQQLQRNYIAEFPRVAMAAN